MLATIYSFFKRKEKALNTSDYLITKFKLCLSLVLFIPLFSLLLFLVTSISSLEHFNIQSHNHRNSSGVSSVNNNSTNNISSDSNINTTKLLNPEFSYWDYLYLENEFYSKWFITVKIILLLQLLVIIFLFGLSLKNNIDNFNFPPYSRNYIGKLSFDFIIFLSVYISVSRMTSNFSLLMLDMKYSNSINEKHIDVGVIFNPIACLLFLALLRVLCFKGSELIARSFSLVMFWCAWYFIDIKIVNDQLMRNTETIVLFLMLGFSGLTCLLLFVLYDKLSFYNTSPYEKTLSITELNKSFCYFLCFVLGIDTVFCLYLFKNKLDMVSFTNNNLWLFVIVLVINSLSLSVLWVNKLFFHFFHNYEEKKNKKTLNKYYKQFVKDIRTKRVFNVQREEFLSQKELNKNSLNLGQEGASSQVLTENNENEDYFYYSDESNIWEEEEEVVVSTERELRGKIGSDKYSASEKEDRNI